MLVGLWGVEEVCLEVGVDIGVWDAWVSVLGVA